MDNITNLKTITMNALETTYLGLKLDNPVIAASSPLTATIDKLRILEEHGAAAVVLKSVFEEQIEGEAATLERYANYPEAADYLNHYVEQSYLRTHLHLIAEAKKKLRIPVIASVNCFAGGKWTEYAKQVEQAGADALELNVFYLPSLHTQSSADIEQKYLDAVQAVTEKVGIPVGVKLGIRFTNVFYMIEQIAARGAKGVVLYNRFFEPDIDLENLKFIPSEPTSSPAELRNTLRTMAIASSLVPRIDYAASTGVFTGEDMAKAILTGASAVQVFSTLQRNGLGAIEKMKSGLKAWMEGHSYGSVEGMKGMLNFKETGGDEHLQRVQYMKFFPHESL